MTADLIFTFNPVNLNESTPVGTVLSQVSDPDVNDTTNTYMTDDHLDKFSIDQGKYAMLFQLGMFSIFVI